MEQVQCPAIEGWSFCWKVQNLPCNRMQICLFVLLIIILIVYPQQIMTSSKRHSQTKVSCALLKIFKTCKTKYYNAGQNKLLTPFLGQQLEYALPIFIFLALQFSFISTVQVSPKCPYISYNTNSIDAAPTTLPLFDSLFFFLLTQPIGLLCAFSSFSQQSFTLQAGFPYK